MMIDITKRKEEGPEVIADREMIEETDLVVEVVEDIDEIQAKTEIGEEKEILVKKETEGEEDPEALIEGKGEDLSET